MNFGTFIPFIIIFAVIVIAIYLQNRNNPSTKDHYDERQELIRKNAYRYSATTMIVCAVIYFVVTFMSERSFAEDGVSAFLIALIGIAVFAVYSIFKGAFFGVKGKRNGTGRPLIYVIILLIIIIGNGIGAARMFRENLVIRNGQLTSNVLQFAIAVLFLLVLISLGIKYLLNAREAQEE